MYVFLKQLKDCMPPTVEVTALHILIVVYFAAGYAGAIAVVITSFIRTSLCNSFAAFSTSCAIVGVFLLPII